jgi:hypothetical protein
LVCGSQPGGSAFEEERIVRKSRSREGQPQEIRLSEKSQVRSAAKPVEQALDEIPFAGLLRLKFALKLLGKLFEFRQSHARTVDQHPIAAQITEFSWRAAI